MQNSFIDKIFFTFVLALTSMRIIESHRQDIVRVYVGSLGGDPHDGTKPIPTEICSDDSEVLTIHYLATMLAMRPLRSGGNHLWAVPLATAYTDTKATP